MNNNFKKILASTLAAALVAGGSSLTFARQYADVQKESKGETEISILSDLGIILGTGENEFSPDKKVTREQMAMLLFRLMLGRDDAGQINSTAFTDLYEPHYNGAISWANAAGLIKGVGGDRFNPTGGITKQDAMTMLVRALGHSDDRMNGGYPWSYISAATRLGLDKGLEDVPYTATLTRAETAMMLYNALTSDYIVTKTQSGAVIEVSTSVIEEVFGYTITDATVIATNDYALDGSTVVKEGYVSLRVEKDGKETIVTVPAKDMGLNGNGNTALGKTYRVICRETNGKYSVISAVQTTEVEKYSGFTVNKNGTVTIGDVKYTLVDRLNDELMTNANELVMYYVSESGTVTVIPDSEVLSAVKGFVSVEMMRDGGKVTHAVLKTYALGEFTVDKNGAIAIAGGNKIDEINAVVPDGVKDGDTVLYRYNREARELEILAVPEIVTDTVIRLNGQSVTVGEKIYSLGNDRAGIKAEDIGKLLSPGKEVSVLVYDGAVIGVLDGVKSVDESKYLISLSDARLVYENGQFRYIMTVYVDGEMKNVTVTDSGAKGGYVYRYTENGGVYSLVSIRTEGNIIVPQQNGFIQENDVGFVIGCTDGSSVITIGKGIYTLNAGNAGYASTDGRDKIGFVTDDDTVIVVNENGKLRQVSGKYMSGVTVNDGAVVLAVMKNEVGETETLRYLYVSDGSLGNYDADAETVRIISCGGLVYADGKVMTEYTVYSFADGKVMNVLSEKSGLEAGEDYRLGADGTVTSDKGERMLSDKVNGYTAQTVTIGNETYTVNDETKIVVLRKDGTIGTSTVAELYEKNVEFVRQNGAVTLILVDEATVK